MNLTADGVNQILVYQDGVLQSVVVNGTSSPWLLEAMRAGEGPQPYSFVRSRW